MDLLLCWTQKIVSGITIKEPLWIRNRKKCFRCAQHRLHLDRGGNGFAVPKKKIYFEYAKKELLADRERDSELISTLTYLAGACDVIR